MTSEVLVRVEELDSLGAQLSDSAKVLMKVDVEGTENDVFRHGQQLLSRYQPIILCEVLEDRADAAELMSLLIPHDYRFFQVRMNSLVESTQILPNEVYRDWLFIPSGEDLEGLGVQIP